MRIMNKEIEIGDCFKLGNTTLKVVKEVLDNDGNTCTKCYFYNNSGCDLNMCSSRYRKDKISVNFVKIKS